MCGAVACLQFFWNDSNGGHFGVLDPSTGFVLWFRINIDFCNLLTGSKTEEPKATGDSLAQFQKGAVVMVCRTCGKKGDHWTSRCPYKDLAPPSEGFVDKPPTSDAAAAAPGSTKGAYVPRELDQTCAAGTMRTL
ncbi:hypothetical protein PIB30_003095 [Stylosanthes scabra]|uniref:Eukaryotic translation initiation factor 3 subunit G N-terminal domain-containing protein n=1 Tax=Stylosanthes scabra TaxID=79078 RepID=A0ABU6Y3P2_9FABA|nr:hypothetical protein [Stylosanthes scabra]